MSVTGGIKFFKKNKMDIDVDLDTFTVSSGSSTRDFIRDRKRYTKWESVGSDDSTVETIEVTFSAAQTLTRIILIKNNWKNFNIQYWNGAAYTDFSNVVTKEGTQASVTETANTKETNYYEFDSVSTTKVKATINTTQTVDAEKYLYQMILTEELGTYAGYPQYLPNFTRNPIANTTIRGLAKFSIRDEGFSCSLSFQNYTTSADHTLNQTLWNHLKEFYVYPCGANEDQFRYQVQGNRLEDIYLVWFASNFSPSYLQSVYKLPLSYVLSLQEVG